MLRFGIIGAGAISQSGYNGITKSGKAEVVAVADKNDARCAEFAQVNGISKRHAAAEDLLADRDIDAVYIALPNAFHAPVAEAALAAGKHVILDKPFALSIDQALAVAAAAKTAGKLFMVGMNQRFAEEPQKIKALAAQGLFGDLYHAKAFWRRRSGIPKAGTWFGNKALAGGGSLLDIGVHLLDLALYTIDNFEPEAVSGAVYTKFGNRGIGFGGWGKSDNENLAFDVDDLATALIKLKGGVTVTLNTSWACHQRDENQMNVEVFGTDAGAGLYPAEVYRADYRLQAYEVITKLNPPLPYPHSDRFVNFVRAVLGEEAPCVTIEQSLAVQRILDGIYESARTGHEVRITR